MVLTKEIIATDSPTLKTSAKKRRVRRKKAKLGKEPSSETDNCSNLDSTNILPDSIKGDDKSSLVNKSVECKLSMSSKESPKSREDVMAAREAKKLAKLKNKSEAQSPKDPDPKTTTPATKEKENVQVNSEKGKDEVDKAVITVQTEIKDLGEKSKEQIKADRAAKKLAKQAKKKGAGEGETAKENENSSESVTNKSVAETITSIVDIAKEVQEITAKVNAFLKTEGAKVVQKPEESGKSKAELKAERRAKQEAQRAAKQAQAQPATAVPAKLTSVDKEKEKSPKPKLAESKTKSKAQLVHRAAWFQHLYKEAEDPLQNVPLNSNLHPAIIKLGVQLATRVVTGSNARCIALLDALKKMISDFLVPARAEFGRALESALTASLAHVWRARPPCAAMTNAVKYLRHHITQLPNNVDEFDAKKKLQEEIDQYIVEQIDMAGEAISLAVRGKISSGDNILTYGCSSLIARILTEAGAAGVSFRAVVAGSRVHGAAREMTRRLAAAGVPVTYVDVTALSYVMATVDKVLLGASSLLVNGSVLGALGTAQTALVAREYNVPVLVCCETHKFSERVQTDAFVYNELGDPDDLIDKTDDNSPIKDWRSNPNLTPLNLTYDVTPAALVTAVVTELAVLPCTSAPVVLRFKLSEYGI